MISLNKATIIGNVTRDPELRYIPSGQAVCNFSVATNRRFKNAQGDLQEDVQFHDVVAWGKVAEIVTQIFKKGNKVYIDGRLQTRQWDAPDGSKRSRTEIVLEQFVPLTPKSMSETTHVEDVSKSEYINEGVVDLKPDKPEKSEKSNLTQPVDQIPNTEEEINLDDIPF